jgi:large subunit ribosomal protein L4
MENTRVLEYSENKKKAIGLIHRVYLTQLKNAYVHTAHTKTKSEVRGGGRKPWRQKGTGNARSGSRRSPLWKGGGVSFGPKPRTSSRKINKKERRLATLSAFYLKKKQFLFIDENIFNKFETIKTKNVIEILVNSGIKNDSKVLFILTESNKNLWIASRNLKNVTITTANCLNIDQLLKTNHIILSKNAIEAVNLTYGKSYT